MKRKAGELLLIIIFYLLQVSFGRAIAIADIVPNFLIILPVLFGFFQGKNEGMFVGFFSGAMYDLYFSGLFGFSSLIFVYIGYFAGFFYQNYEENEMLIPMSMVLMADFVFAFLSYVGNFLLHNRLNVGFFMSRFILPEVVYTLIISILVYKPILFISKKFDIVTSRRSIKKVYERDN